MKRMQVLALTTPVNNQNQKAEQAVTSWFIFSKNKIMQQWEVKQTNGNYKQTSRWALNPFSALAIVCSPELHAISLLQLIPNTTHPVSYNTTGHVLETKNRN